MDSKNICILSTGNQQMLVDEGKRLGHNVFVVNPADCDAHLDKPGYDKLYWNGKHLPKKNIDVVLCRGGLKGYGNTILNMFESMNIPTTATADAISTAADQMKTIFCLAKNKIPHIKTNWINTDAPNVADRFFEAVNRVGGYPFVLKELVSSQGNGVFKIEAEDTALWAIKSYAEGGKKVMLQKYIKTSEDGAVGYRVWVIGGKIAGGMLKRSLTDWRDNASKGAEVLPVQLTDEQKELAINAAAAVGLEIAAIDLMTDVHTKKNYVIEANSNGGLKYISQIERQLKEHIILYAVHKANGGEGEFEKGYSNLSHYANKRSYPTIQNVKFYNSNKIANRVSSHNGVPVPVYDPYQNTFAFEDDPKVISRGEFLISYQGEAYDFGNNHYGSFLSKIPSIKIFK